MFVFILRSLKTGTIEVMFDQNMLCKVVQGLYYNDSGVQERKGTLQGYTQVRLAKRRQDFGYNGFITSRHRPCHTGR